MAHDQMASGLGAVLRQLRLDARLSQRDLALRIGFHESGVSNIERGERAPSAQYLENVIVALRLTQAVAADLWGLYRRATGSGIATHVDVNNTAPCPYRGLFSFREEDAGLFHGRNKAVRRIVRKLEASALVAVVGASGSGKSSVVFAGVVPSLRRSAVWDVVALRPGADPVRALNDAVKIGEDGRKSTAIADSVDERTCQRQQPLLIVIDQFEELYTHGSDEQAVAGFLDILVSLVRAAHARPVKILLTFRGDFYGRVIGHRDFSDVMQDHVVHLPPMSRSELSQAITEPARTVGLTLEDGLSDRILDDAGTEPGNLPLLEFALTRLWEHQQGRTLTLDAYEQVGRLAGAITARAEEVYTSLSPEEQYAARQLLVRLVQVARPEEDLNDARRRTSVAELSSLAGVGAVIQALANARLIVTDADTASNPTVELAHEAIIRSWTRLRGWLVEDRHFLLWQQRARQWMDQWRHASDHEAALLRGGILDEAQRWLTLKGRESIAPDLLAYLDSSIAESRAEARRQALARIDQLLTVLPRDVAELAMAFADADEELREALLRQLDAARPRQRWRLRLALLANDSVQSDLLIEDLSTLWPDELVAVKDASRSHHAWLNAGLWDAATAGPPSGILAAAVLLADADPDDARWHDIAPAVASSLVSQNQLHLRTYVDALRPVRIHLLEPLFELFADGSELRFAVRETRAVILLELAADQPELLARMAAEAMQQNYEPIFAALAETVTPEAISVLKSIANTVPEDDTAEAHRVRLGKRRAAALCTLIRLGVEPDLDNALAPAPDPELLTQFTFFASERGVAVVGLLDRLGHAIEPRARYALLLALGEYARPGHASALVDRIGTEAHNRLGNDDAGVRAAAQWLLRRWDLPTDAAPQAAYDPTGRRNWFTISTTDSVPLTFTVFRPGRFLMGSPSSESERSEYEGPLQDTTISRSYALCNREVSRAEFELWMADPVTGKYSNRDAFPNIDEWSPLGVEPVVAPTWDEAKEYARSNA